MNVNLFAEHADRQCHVDRVSIDGDTIKHTSRQILDEQLAPLQRVETFGALRRELERASARLQHLALFSGCIFDVSVAHDGQEVDDGQRNVDNNKPCRPPVRLEVSLRAEELKRCSATAGVEVAGSSHTSSGQQTIGGNCLTMTMALRNLFGRGVAFALEAARGAGPATDAVVRVPLEPNATSNYGTEVELRVARRTQSRMAYASHDEQTTSARASLRATPLAIGRTTACGTRGWVHECGYELANRQMCNLGPNASVSVHFAAAGTSGSSCGGRSVKSSVYGGVRRDTRDSAALASNGTLVRADAELAGLVLGGDANHFKVETLLQVCQSLGVKDASIAATVAAGAVLPLGAAGACNIPFSDRLYFGGTLAPRGFEANTLGPRDGDDALGGTLGWRGGLSVFLPVPGLRAHASWLRAHAFLNAGGLFQCATGEHVRALAVQGGSRLVPSTSAGVGVAIKYASIRFEINYAVPIVVRRGDRFGRRLSFTLGANYL